MARIRSVHPGLPTDEAYMSMSAYAKAAWPLLWMECDDQGAFEWKPIVLKARLLPADAVDFAALLDELAALNAIASYEVDGKRYGLVRNFAKFQRPKKPANKYPVPDSLRPFAGLPPIGTELVPNQFPTGGEKPPQRKEEGGKRGEEKKETPEPLRGSPPAPPADASSPPSSKPVRAAQGGYLPDGWMPSEPQLAEGQKRLGPGVDVRDALEAFREHWGAASGQNARKRDWGKAWLGWCRLERKFQSRAGPQRRQNPIDNLMLATGDMLDAIDRSSANSEPEILTIGGLPSRGVQHLEAVGGIPDPRGKPRANGVAVGDVPRGSFRLPGMGH